jgi:hypothetical protein
MGTPVGVIGDRTTVGVSPLSLKDYGNGNVRSHVD